MVVSILVKYGNPFVNIATDLTMNNIFLRLGQLDAMTSNEIFQKFGHPKKESVMKMDGMPLVPSIPKYSIAPVETSITAATVTDTDLVISDFGAASMVSSMPSQIVTAAATRPPEAHLNLTRHSRFAGDIWSTACVAYNVLANGPLFRLVPFCQPEHESAQILQQISKLLGPPPDDMLTAWNSASEFSDGKKQLKEEAWGEQTPLREKMAGMRRLLGRPQYDFSIEEIGDLHDLLERMLKWRPCERISADEACQSKWMQQWGLPAIERTGG